MGIILNDFTPNPDITVNLSTPPTDMVRYVLKIDGIQADHPDPSQNGEIELQTWAWGESQSAIALGGSNGKVEIQDLQFTMSANRTSPQLALACATGKHLKQAILTGHRTNKPASDFLKIILSDVVVSAFHTEVTADHLPSDRISLHFASIEYEYTTQKPDGSLDKDHMGWHLTEHRFTRSY